LWANKRFARSLTVRLICSVLLSWKLFNTE
jgi:hypothetical protein